MSDTVDQEMYLRYETTQPLVAMNAACELYLQGFVLQRSQPGRRVDEDIEVRGGWGSHREGPALCIHLVVDQTPLLQKRMNPKHRKH